MLHIVAAALSDRSDRNHAHAPTLEISKRISNIDIRIHSYAQDSQLPRLRRPFRWRWLRPQSRYDYFHCAYEEARVAAVLFYYSS